LFTALFTIILSCDITVPHQPYVPSSENIYSGSLVPIPTFPPVNTASLVFVPEINFPDQVLIHSTCDIRLFQLSAVSGSPVETSSFQAAYTTQRRGKQIISKIK